MHKMIKEQIRLIKDIHNGRAVIDEVLFTDEIIGANIR
jgi:hypothetical protein